ncbi:MAG: Protease inhibitor precursor [Firmicutes bacterium ADurb.Bin193]|nr:MAG: Protease inhibitor precursor [Firmicutes bacterium ADurb.Bin193]
MKYLKKIISLLFAAVLMITMCFSVSADAEKVTVSLDGVEITFPDAQPFIDARDRTLVPIRFVSEAMGAEVSWENETQTVTIVKEKDTISYQIYSYGALLNGQMKVFDSYGILKDDRTMVPLRFISELLSCNVDWVKDTQTVIITSPGEAIAFPEPKLTFNYPQGEYDKRLLWITLDNYRDFERNCPNYEFKIEFLSPSEFNEFEQDEGEILGWQSYNRDIFKKLVLTNSTVTTLTQENYTTRANKKKITLSEGMEIKVKLTVRRNCSGEEREYIFTETMQYPYPVN